MKIELDLPERTIASLRSQSETMAMSLDNYAAEIFDQYFIAQSEGEEDKLTNLPDWQAAVERSRDAWNNGGVHSHDEILAWHNSHPE